MNDVEWELAQHVSSLLKPFYEATQYFCRVFKLLEARTSCVRSLVENIKNFLILTPGLLLHAKNKR